MIIELPEWDDIEEKISSGKELTPLDFFIREYTPAGNDDELLFRKDLYNAISYLVG